MDRRGFLMAIAPAFTIDPDRLLWRPGEKHFSIPKPPATHYTFDSAGRLHVLPPSSVWFTYRTRETSLGIYVSEIIPVRNNLPMDLA